METIIYTCITNNYDKLNEINTKERAICFTDQDLVSETWEIVKIKPLPKIFRKIKICPHRFLPSHARSVWIDGNLYAEDIDSLIRDKYGFWTMTHPNRKCIYVEAMHCIMVNKDTEETLTRQVTAYYKKGYPFENGLVTTSVLIRDHNKINTKFAELWWSEVRRHSVRDQVSFNYVAWKVDLQFQLFPFLKGLKKNAHQSF